MTCRSKPKNYGKVFFESAGEDDQSTFATANESVKLVTPKQAKYATDIANLLDLPLPNLNDLSAVTEFITINKNRFYEVKKKEDDARMSNDKSRARASRKSRVVNDKLCLQEGETVAVFLARIDSEDGGDDCLANQVD